MATVAMTAFLCHIVLELNEPDQLVRSLSSHLLDYGVDPCPLVKYKGCRQSFHNHCPWAYHRHMNYRTQTQSSLAEEAHPAWHPWATSRHYHSLLWCAWDCHKAWMQQMGQRSHHSSYLPKSSNKHRCACHTLTWERRSATCGGCGHYDVQPHVHGRQQSASRCHGAGRAVPLLPRHPPHSLRVGRASLRYCE